VYDSVKKGEASIRVGLGWVLVEHYWDMPLLIGEEPCRSVAFRSAATNGNLNTSSWLGVDNPNYLLPNGQTGALWILSRTYLLYHKAGPSTISR